jgi:hypothetical protein
MFVLERMPVISPRGFKSPNFVGFSEDGTVMHGATPQDAIALFIIRKKLKSSRVSTAFRLCQLFDMVIRWLPGSRKSRGMR